jgi:hypothetical protein
MITRRSADAPRLRCLITEVTIARSCRGEPGSDLTSMRLLAGAGSSTGWLQKFTDRRGAGYGADAGAPVQPE